MAASGDSSGPGGHPDMGTAVDDIKMKTTLDKGRDLMENKEYSKALRTIMEVVNMCPCSANADGGQARHGKDKTCNVHQWVAALDHEDDPDALYLVSQGPCACGYAWPGCAYPLHAVALDALAECLEKAGQHLSAFSTALSIIRLNPISSVGYCRAAKMLQNMHKNSSVPSDTALGRAQAVIMKGYTCKPPAHPFRQLLRRLVEGGLHTTGQYRDKSKDIYDVVLQRMAHNLNIKQARRDPAVTLPREVFGMILALLPSSDLSRCLLVSKSWNQAVERDDALWSNLEYAHPGNPSRFFGKFVQKHPKIRSLIIHDGSAFQVTGAKLNIILHGLRHLRRLVLHSGMVSPSRQEVEFKVESRPGAPVPRSALRHLSLFSFNAAAPSSKLIELNMNSLRILDLFDIGPVVSEAFSSIVLPRLARLRIMDTDTGRAGSGFSLRVPVLEMAPIVAATPNLKEVQLSGPYMVIWGGYEVPMAGKRTFWRDLEVLVLGPRLGYWNWSPQFLLPLPSSLRRLEILAALPELTHNLLSLPASAAPNPPGTDDLSQEDGLTTHLPNLEVFRCLAGMLNPRTLEAIIGPAAKSGTLKVLELSASLETSATRVATMASPAIHDDFAPMRDYACAHSDALHTLSLHDFNFHRDPASRFGASSRFDGQPFLDWLECFPALHTVAVYPGDWDGVDTFLMRLIIHPRVKVLYQKNLRGSAWDQALALAKKHGVKLVHKPDGAFEEWPLTEDWVMRE